MDSKTQEPMQLALVDPGPLDLVGPDVVAAMRKLFNRRWRKWHPCARFEDACADPFTFRLLALAVQKGRGGVDGGR